MNFRTLKNGTRIEEPHFQVILAEAREKNPDTTEEAVLEKLNNPAKPITTLKPVTPKARTPRKPGQVT